MAVATKALPMTAEQMDLFQSVPERRENDSIAVLPMQQVYDKLDAMDKKLTLHMGEEASTLVKELAAIMSVSFPGGDGAGHRTYHEAQMQVVLDKAQFWKTMRTEVSKYGLLGVIGWVTYAVWISFLKGPK